MRTALIAAVAAIVGLGLIEALPTAKTALDAPKVSVPVKDVASDIGTPTPSTGTSNEPSIVSNPTKNVSKAYSRRSFRLGMSIAEFKSSKHPDAANLEYSKQIELHCSDENSDGLIAALRPNSERDAMYQAMDNPYGRIRCKFYRNNGRFLESERILLGNLYPIDEVFYFVPTSESADPVLYYIDITIDSHKFQEVWDVFHEAYGAPTEVEEPSVQNGFGNTFINTTVVYQNEVSAIVLTRFKETIDHSSVEYILLPVNEELRKKITEKNGRPSDRL